MSESREDHPGQRNGLEVFISALEGARFGGKNRPYRGKGLNGGGEKAFLPRYTRKGDSLVYQKMA